MNTNQSPWLQALAKRRAIHTLTTDASSDVVIVGAGISGIATAFFLLKYTQCSVIILEKDRLAHGASGHNAGQITPEFEKPLTDLVAQFGRDLVCHSLAEIERSFSLVDELSQELGEQTRPLSVVGYDGIAEFSMLQRLLDENVIRASGGLAPIDIAIDREAAARDPLQILLKNPVYNNFYRIVDRSDILENLHTRRTDIFAYASGPRAVANSALICEELVEWCEKQYPERFTLYEDTEVTKIIFHDDKVLVDAGQAVVTGDMLVMCTNGFHNFTLVNEHGLDLNKAFHKHVFGYVGTMAGYVIPEAQRPFAISFLTEALPDYMDETFMYMTRRPFSDRPNTSLITIGGPGYKLGRSDRYTSSDAYQQSHVDELITYASQTLTQSPDHGFDFIWHGLMGYTQSGVRLIGRDPYTPRLFFNMGCNGIGLLTAIYGARRIARIVLGEDVEPTMFDIPFMEQ